MPKIQLPLAISALLLFGAVALAQDSPVVVDPAIASMTSEQLVAARQDAMKQNGGLLRGAGQLSGDEAAAAATTLLQNFTNLPSLFKEGSMVGNSKALPIIWEQWDSFNAILTADAASALAMLEAAKAGDATAYGAAVQAIGQSCNTCHNTYRGR